jgi:hypothetical protein
MEEVPKPRELLARGGLWFRSGTVVVHLGVDEDFHPARKAHPAFLCSGYDVLLARLEEHEVPIVVDKPLADGREHCYATDPFGNRIELIRD